MNEVLGIEREIFSLVCRHMGLRKDTLEVLLGEPRLGILNPNVESVVDGMVGKGILRLGKDGMIRKGCDIKNKNPDYKDKVKVYKVHNSECGQWILFEDFDSAAEFISQDLKEMGVDLFNYPESFEYTLEIDYMIPEEVDNLPEFDGC